MRKYFEKNESKNTTHQNIQNAAQAVLTVKCIAVDTILKK